MTTREECSETVSQRVRIKGFAFPHYQDVPTERLQLALLYRISFDVALEFVCPECRADFWSRGAAATLMSMPEASMDEYDLSQPWKDQIRRSWQTANVKAKAIPHTVCQPAYDHLGFGILVTDSRHKGRPRWVDGLSCQRPNRQAPRSATFVSRGFKHPSDILTRAPR